MKSSPSSKSKEKESTSLLGATTSGGGGYGRLSLAEKPCYGLVGGVVAKTLTELENACSACDRNADLPAPSIHLDMTVF